MLASERSSPPYQIGLPLSRSLNHDTVRMSLPQRYFVYPDCPWSSYRISSKLLLHISFVQGFDCMPVQFQLFGYILDGHGSTLASYRVGKPLRIKGVVRQPGKFFPFHLATLFAVDPPDFHFQIDPGIPAGHIPYTSHCLVVVTAMHGTAVTACCFFWVLSRRITRALGSPNTPFILDRGRNPGNWYSSSNLLFLSIHKSYSFIGPFETHFILICRHVLLILSLQITHTPTR
jgi:hypothetical protein